LKGQFFIISSIIIISAIVISIQYFFDFSRVDLTKVEERAELNAINTVMNSLKRVIDNDKFKCSQNPPVFEPDIIEAENLLKSGLISRNIKLDIKHTIISCPTTYFNFNITTRSISSKTEFTYP